MARASARVRYLDRVFLVLDVHVSNTKFLTQRFHNTWDIFRWGLYHNYRFRTVEESSLIMADRDLSGFSLQIKFQEKKKGNVISVPDIILIHEKKG